MKLNIGCGKQYIPGYVNVDLHESAIADEVAPAGDLAFVKNGSVKEILSFQLIEQLGYIETHRTLAHWAQKLEPGGTLVLETPELETSLKALSTTKALEDKDWVFGVRDRGLQHKYPYFAGELMELLKLIGFTKFKLEEPQGFWKENTIRLKSTMGSSTYRAEVIEKWSGLDMSHATFRSVPFNHLKGTLTDTKLAELAIISPALASIALKSSTKRTDKEKKVRMQVLDRLNDEKLILRLYQQVLIYDRTVYDQFKSVKSIVTGAKKMLLNWFKSGKVDWDYLKLDKSTRKLLGSYPEYSKYFCFHNINELSISECALGIKLFAKKKYVDAMANFTNSVRFNSENTIAWWNLGRLEWLNGHKLRGLEAFDNAFKLSRDSNILEEKDRKVPLKRPVEIGYATEA
jgi:predicted SAM-dependent methyltransferase